MKTLAPLIGCGPCALLTLTGESPLEIFKFCNEYEKDEVPGTSAETMVAFLESKGYIVRKVTDNDFCTSRTGMNNALQMDHVLLSGRKVANGMASWFVNWGQFEFHNLVEAITSTVSFLNRPPTENEGIFVVFHPKWKLELAPLDEYAAKRDLRHRDPVKQVARADACIDVCNHVVKATDQIVQELVVLAREHNLTDVQGSLEKYKETLERFAQFGTLYTGTKEAAGVKG